MRLDGLWHVGKDRITRPVVNVGLVGPTGAVETFGFLLDTGADATVLTYWAVAYLGAEVEPASQPLGGFGGDTPAVTLNADLYLLNSSGDLVRLGGRVFGKAHPTGDDLCVLGRDLMNNFAVIVDRPADTVCLLSGRHRYVIQES